MIAMRYDIQHQGQSQDRADSLRRPSMRRKL